MKQHTKQWINTVVENATDACQLINQNFDSMEEWAELLYSPQGIEYCTSRNYPTLDMWRSIPLSDTELLDYHIFIDAGSIEVSPREKTLLIGDTTALIKIKQPSELHNVVLLHGASATIVAQNYAVVRIDKSQDSEIKIIKDSTAIVL